ncbi:MAG: hypothetical protein K8R69_00890 [Deltaproteobacteria bacterium]|nr:hypothetical protein [Deltaproteobacteria bacterium]
MSDTISSRVPDAKASVSSAPGSKEIASEENSGPESFLKLIIDNATDYRRADSSASGLKSIQTPIDRLARERVFDSIVRKTLENPEHPYYSLVSPATRRDMIERITEKLNSSHYLIQTKRQA